MRLFKRMENVLRYENRGFEDGENHDADSQYDSIPSDHYRMGKTIWWYKSIQIGACMNFFLIG